MYRPAGRGGVRGGGAGLGTAAGQCCSAVRRQVRHNAPSPSLNVCLHMNLINFLTASGHAGRGAAVLCVAAITSGGRRLCRRKVVVVVATPQGRVPQGDDTVPGGPGDLREARGTTGAAQGGPLSYTPATTALLRPQRVRTETLLCAARASMAPVALSCFRPASAKPEGHSDQTWTLSSCATTRCGASECLKEDLFTAGRTCSSHVTPPPP